jgi:hypothetical protein
MAGGNFINYKTSASVCTADLDTTKLHWNSIISTALAKYMCLDIKNFCLTAVLEYYKYMKILLTLFPEWIVEQYNLTRHVLHGFVHLEMRRAVWGLPQAGILVNKCLKQKLAPFGYYESTNTPGLWLQDTRPILFTWVVDDFRVEYVNSNNMQHLIASIKENYSLTKCDNILRGYLYVVTTVLSHQDGIYGFKFPNRFSEISCLCRDLTSLFKTLFSLLLV